MSNVRPPSSPPPTPSPSQNPQANNDRMGDDAEMDAVTVAAPWITVTKKPTVVIQLSGEKNEKNETLKNILTNVKAVSSKLIDDKLYVTVSELEKGKLLNRIPEAKEKEKEIRKENDPNFSIVVKGRATLAQLSKHFAKTHSIHEVKSFATNVHRVTFVNAEASQFLIENAEIFVGGKRMTTHEYTPRSSNVIGANKEKISKTPAFTIWLNHLHPHCKDYDLTDIADAIDAHNYGTRIFGNNCPNAVGFFHLATKEEAEAIMAKGAIQVVNRRAFWSLEPLCPHCEVASHQWDTCPNNKKTVKPSISYSTTTRTLSYSSAVGSQHPSASTDKTIIATQAKEIANLHDKINYLTDLIDTNFKKASTLFEEQAKNTLILQGQILKMQEIINKQAEIIEKLRDEPYSNNDDNMDVDTNDQPSQPQRKSARLQAKEDAKKLRDTAAGFKTPA